MIEITIHQITGCLNSITVKILVATGKPYSNGIHSEVIAIRTNTNTYGNALYQLHGATGGFVKYWPLVCGGSQKDVIKYNKCWFFGDKNSTIEMQYERVFASSIVTHGKVSI